MSETRPRNGGTGAPAGSRGRCPAPRRAGVIESFAERMMYSVAKDVHTATDVDIYFALAYAVRDRLMERGS